MSREQMKHTMIVLTAAALVSAVRVAIHYYRLHSFHFAFALALLKIAMLGGMATLLYRRMARTEDADRAYLMFMAVGLMDCISMVSDASV